MNTNKLKDAESLFLQKYPGGFMHPDMQALGKKHKMGQMIEFAQEHFAKKAFADPALLAQNLVKVVSRSSMISLFEKPKFRDWVYQASIMDLELLSRAIKAQLHGSAKHGLESLTELLAPHKLAKWSLVTILPNYYKPDDEVFVKPTTAKDVIGFFELDVVPYKAKPSWAFYEAYREAIIHMKSLVDPMLSPNNAAFCGFLMMSAKLRG